MCMGISFVITSHRIKDSQKKTFCRFRVNIKESDSASLTLQTKLKILVRNRLTKQKTTNKHLRSIQSES